ncbi:MAG: DUF418 domain-containing protein [Leucobacter sp.]
MSATDTIRPRPSPVQRALAPDLARGWMLLLIAIANVSLYLWGHQTPLYTAHPTDGSPLDRALSVLTILFVDARVYPMFAFLFGYGMVQFARSRELRGVPQCATAAMLLRRHLWLLVFGFVHAALLFSGDILGAYGLTGLALTAALFWRPDRALRIAAWIMLGVFAFGAAMMLGVMALLAALLEMGGAETLGAEGFAVEGLAGDGPGSSADVLNGVASYGQALLLRAGTWLISTPATVLSLLVPVCVLLGWIAGRHRWLEGGIARFGLGPVAGWGILIGTLTAVPTALGYLGVLPVAGPLLWGWMLFGQLGGAAGGIGYAALFGLIVLRLRGDPGAVARSVAAVGKRSLSSYLLQSVILAPLLAAWGLGIGARIGTAAAFGIAVGAWLLSLLMAVLLERRSARGPAEVLLRRLTYAHFDDQRIPQSASAPPPGSVPSVPPLASPPAPPSAPRSAEPPPAP